MFLPEEYVLLRTLTVVYQRGDRENIPDLKYEQEKVFHYVPSEHPAVVGCYVRITRKYAQFRKTSKTPAIRPADIQSMDVKQ